MALYDLQRDPKKQRDADLIAGQSEMGNNAS